MRLSRRIDPVLAGLEAVRGTGPNGWTARCPSHDDRKPSLSVTEGEDGRVLIKCHAGCPTELIVQFLGLEMSDLTPRQPNATSRSGIRQSTWPILDASGETVAVHRRRDSPDGKKMWWEQPDGTLGLDGVPVHDLPLYNLQSLLKAPSDQAVVVAEGEKATDALSGIGILAVGTVTGASGTPCDEALRPLLGHETRLWPDAHGVGFEHMDRIAGRLMTMGHEIPQGRDATSARVASSGFQQQVGVTCYQP